MKCGRCGIKNDMKAKFCVECGSELSFEAKRLTVTGVSELYGKEVEVLFFVDPNGEVSGIVNPSEDQVSRHREAVLQKVVIETPAAAAPDENVGALLTFIRQSLEYLGERYDEGHYRHYSINDLKKEYLRLFERILREKSKNMDPKPFPASPEKR